MSKETLSALDKIPGIAPSVKVSSFPSIIPIKYKSNKLLKMLAFLMFPLLLPLILIQVAISWNLSSKKIDEGSLIDTLN